MNIATIMPGALIHSRNALRIVPHGREYYERDIERTRGDVTFPLLLSFAAGIIDANGGFRVAVRDNINDFYTTNEHPWICRKKPYDYSSSFLLVQEPVRWEDIPWLIRECELTILWWARASNNPDVIPGLRAWLLKRDAAHIRRIGRRAYAKQYRKFWNRDLPRDIPIEPMQGHELARFGSKRAFRRFVGAK